MRTGRGLRALISVGLMLSGGLAVAAPAAAQATAIQAPQVLYVAPYVVVNPANPDTARIIGVYRCFGGQPIHLWVSAKQGGPDPTAPHSGATTVSWYDTNIIAPPPVVCDGQWHAAVVTVGRYPNKQRLQAGQTWVQFCLVNSDGVIAQQSMWTRVLGV